MSDPVIITLDGPAGVGKSSLAKRLAAKLNLPCLDSGAMFRCLALALGPDAEALPKQALEARLQELLGGLQFALRGSGEASELLCNGRVPGPEIRTEEISGRASRLAVLPPVREALKLAQQRLGAEIPLVAEGRDMGTVVFPQAICKFFLDADPRVRARRRQLQLQTQGNPATNNTGATTAHMPASSPANSTGDQKPEAVLRDFGKFGELGEFDALNAIEAQIRKRDEQDRNRTIAPLRPAADAIIVDTSHLSLEEVLERLFALASAKTGEK